jgi:hypothetical protein
MMASFETLLAFHDIGTKTEVSIADSERYKLVLES